MRPYGETLKRYVKGVWTWKGSKGGKIKVGRCVDSKASARRIKVDDE
jgi:hypothetical protein